MAKEKRRKTLSEELEESRLAFEAAGIPSAPADHPVYRQGGYIMRFTNPTEESSKSSPTKEDSQQK